MKAEASRQRRQHGDGAQPSGAPHLRDVGTPRAALGGHRVCPKPGQSQKTIPKTHCTACLYSVSPSSMLSSIYFGSGPRANPSQRWCCAGTCCPRRAMVPTLCPALPPVALATPRHHRQPRQLLFLRGFVFTITLLRDYSACGFLARPICFCSAAGGSLPSPKLHAGLYKRPRRLGCGEARAQPGSAAVQGRSR